MGERMGKKMINVEDYALVICIDGSSGRLFEYGKDTTDYVQSLELKHEAGHLAELTVTRSVRSKNANEDFRLNGNEHKPYD